MKVFMCKRRGGYSGGLAVVAANTKEEAFVTFFSSDNYDWMVNKWDFDKHDFIEDPKMWHSDYYPLNCWFECKELTANVEEPCIINEGGFTD